MIKSMINCARFCCQADTTALVPPLEVLRFNTVRDRLEREERAVAYIKPLVRGIRERHEQLERFGEALHKDPFCVAHHYNLTQTGYDKP